MSIMFDYQQRPIVGKEFLSEFERIFKHGKYAEDSPKVRVAKAKPDAKSTEKK